MNLSLNAADLHEIETIAALFTPPAQPLALYGSATFTGALSRSTVSRRDSPASSTPPTCASTAVHGSCCRRIWTPASPRWKFSRESCSPWLPKGAPQGNISFSGRAQLQHWSLTSESQFQLALRAQRLDASQLAQLAGSTTDVSGTLNADVQAHGTELNPIGQGRLELLHASVAGEPIQSVEAQFTRRWS